MALFGLFGGKKNEPQKGDFFLDFEEAQTLGDTEYMKQPKTIKRTFPKVKGKEGKTIISQVSSDNMRSVDPNQVPSRSTSSSSSFASSFGSFASSVASTFTPSKAAEPAMEEKKAPEPVAESKPQTQDTPTLTQSQSFSASSSAPKKVDTSMDMFRNMAKKINR